MGAEPLGYATSVRFLLHASMFFGIYAIWGAEEAAKAEVKAEEASDDT